MKEQNLEHNRDGFMNALFIFAAGLIVGLLAAPKTGRASRAWIGQKMEHLQSLTEKMGRRMESRVAYEQGKLTGAIHKARQLTLVPSQDNEPYVDDDLITQRVRTQLGEHPKTGHLPKLNVDTADRIVTLRGRVESEADQGNVEKITRSVPDVADVINKTIVMRRKATG